MKADTAEDKLGRVSPQAVKRPCSDRLTHYLPFGLPCTPAQRGERTVVTIRVTAITRTIPPGGQIEFVKLATVRKRTDTPPSPSKNP